MRLTNAVLAVSGAAAMALSLLLYRHLLHLIGKNFPFSLQSMVDKHRLKLSIFGLSHVVVGLVVTACWVGIEIILQVIER